MKRTVFRPFVMSPRRLRDGEAPPHLLGRIDFVDLCARAGIRLRVTGGVDRAIVCVAGEDSFVGEGDALVGGANAWPLTRVGALRVLETLAYGFLDYAARECVCRQGLFVPPQRRGRPPTGTRTMTARERMATMRARRAAVSS